MFVFIEIVYQLFFPWATLFIELLSSGLILLDTKRYRYIFELYEINLS